MKDSKGFFAALFDMSFDEFVTTRIIKLLFVLACVGALIMAFTMFVAGIASGDAAGFLISLIFAPVAFVVWVILARVWLELIIVAFRIAENTSRLVEHVRSEEKQPGTDRPYPEA